MIKLTEKAKIVLAVIAVVAVAVGAGAVVALSSSANGAQDSLNAGQPANARAATVVDDFNIMTAVGFDIVDWSKTRANAPSIGTYTNEAIIAQYSAGSYNASSINIEISKIDDSGNIIAGTSTTYGGEGDDGYAQTQNMEINGAGLYMAKVTLDGNAPMYRYARVAGSEVPGKKTLQVDTSAIPENLSYMGVAHRDLAVYAYDGLTNCIGSVVTISVKYVDYYGYERTDGIVFDKDKTSTFDVLNAGQYTVTLKIADAQKENYEFEGEKDTETVSFEVKQALVAFGESDGITVSDTSYYTDLSVEELISKLSLSGFVSAQQNKYAVKFGLFTDGTYSTPLTELTVGTHVYAKVIELLPVSDGDTAYRNYCLPESGETGYDKIKTDFVLQSPPLSALTITANYYSHHPEEIEFPDTYSSLYIDGNTINATYLNFDYKLSQWFYGDEDKWSLPIAQGGHESGEHWIVTVDGNVVNPNTYGMKNAGTYNIKVQPKEGYRFSGNTTEYNYTLKISPFTLDAAYINWKTIEHVYDGNPVPFGEDDYELTLWSDDDELKLIFEQIDGNNKVVEEAPVRAGYYTFRVKAISDESKSKSNYKLPLYDLTNGGAFTIYRQELPNFSGTPLVTGDFNGQLQIQDVAQLLEDLQLGYKNDEGNFVPRFQQDGNSIIITRSYPQSWNLGNAIFQDDATLGYDMDTGKYSFKYMYAGSYSLSIVATEMLNNYCWYGRDNRPLVGVSFDSTPYVWENFALIERAEVNPLFTPTNISTKDDDINIAGQIANKFDGLTNGGSAVYTLTYGRGSTTGATPLDKNPDGSYKEGDYYVLVNLADNMYPSVYFKAPENGEYSIINDGKTARIDYSVKSGVVDIAVKVTDYTFGDNFASGFNVDSVVAVTTKPAQDVVYGNIEIKFYTDHDCEHEVATAARVNGVPRNAGTYYVKVTVAYTLGGEAATPWSRSYELNVAKLQVALSWRVDNSTTTEFTYDNTSHTVTVTNTNTINGVDNVTFTLENATVTNAGTHTFTVTEINGTEADNYTLDGVTNDSFSVVINRAAISVTAKDVSNVTIGQALTLPSPAYEVTGGASALFLSQHGSDLSVAVYSVAGGNLSLVSESSYGSLNRGAYLVVPAISGVTVPVTLNNNAYSADLQNYTVTFTAKGFSVVAETLIITLYGGSNSDYGVKMSDIDLYVPRVDGVGIYTINLNLSPEQVKSIVTITLKTKSGTTVSPTATPSAGEYLLTATSKGDDGDYTVQVKYVDANGNNATQAIYKINFKEIFVHVNPVTDHRYANPYPQSYNVKTITDKSGNEVTDSSIVISNKVYNYQNATWTDWSGYVSTSTVGKYYHVPVLKNAAVGTDSVPILEDENGKFYYVTEIGNYVLTAYIEDFIIKPRLITLTFSNGTVQYGDSINLWKQNGNLSSQDKYCKYVYVSCNASDLRYYDLTDLKYHNLQEVISLSLFANDTAYNPSVDKINAGTYGFKATITNDNYAIANGENEVTEIVGGTFTVTPKAVTVTVSASKTSIVYGNTLTSAGITLNHTVQSGALLEGDELGVTVGIYNSADEAIADISTQNVGTNYYVGLDWTNKNYAVTYPTVNFAVTKRAASITPVAVTNHVYGEALSGTLSFTHSNFVSEAHVTAMNVTAQVYNGSTPVANADISKLAVNTYTIKLSVANANDNYTVTLNTANFVVTQRAITITAQDVTNHVYGSGWKDGDKANELKYSITSGSRVNNDNLNVVLTVIDSDNHDVTNNIATLSKGNYTIKVTASNSNYNITTVNATLTIAVLEAKVTFKENVKGVYGEPISLDELRGNIRDNKLFSITGLLEGDEDQVNISIVKRGDSSVVATSLKAPVGDYEVIVTLGGNYDVEYINHKYDNSKGAYAIEKRSVKLVANDASIVYGNTFNVSSLTYKVADDTAYQPLEGDNLGVTLGVFSGSNNISGSIATQNVSSYAIKIDVSAANSNYSITAVDGAFTITQATITLTAKPVSVTYGDALSVSGNWYTASSSDTTQATINAHLAANAVTHTTNYVKASTQASAAGITITPVCSGNTNVKVVTNSAAVTVNKRVITLTFTADGGTSVYGATVDLYSNAVGALGANDLVNGATYQNVVTLTAKIGGNTMAQLNNGVGSYVVSATIANANYVFAGNSTTAPTTGKYAITPATITWTGSVEANKTYNYSGDAYSVDNVSTKLNFNVVNSAQNSVTVEYLVYEAGHACDATLPWNNATTTVPSFTNVGAYTVYVRFTASNHNAAYYNTLLKLTINKSTLTITAKNHSVTYGDELTLLDDWYTASSANITEATIAAYLSNNAVTYSTNYNKATTQANATGITITPVCASDSNVNVEVNSGNVTVNKRDITISYVNDKYSVYGDSAVAMANLYEITSGSLVNGDTLTVAALKDGDSAYADKANAGTYTVNVAVAAAAAANYNVSYANGNSGVYTIKQRVLTATLENATITYTEETDTDGKTVYNNGVYGAEHNAIVKLTNKVDGDVLSVNNGYTIAYSTETIGSWQAAGKAPKAVGTYNVTVTLTDNNYTFVDGDDNTDSVILEKFEVVKKTINTSDLVWESELLEYNASANQTNVINGYIAEIMQAEVTMTTAGSKGQYNDPITLAIGSGNAVENAYYFFENGKLSISVRGRAKYTARISLTSDASNNYEIDGDALSIFIVANLNAAELTIKTTSWQYGEIPTVVPNGNVDVEINAEETYYGFNYYYAYVTNESGLDALLALKKSEDFKGFEADQVAGLYDGTLTYWDVPNMVNGMFEVGYYVICVTYDGLVGKDGEVEIVNIAIYDVVAVTKKVLTAPTFTSVTYNGQEQRLTVNYGEMINGVALNTIITANYNGNSIAHGGSVPATNAGDYEILFSIKSAYSNRYTWALDKDDLDKIVIWTIEKDTAENDYTDDNEDNNYFKIDDITVIYGETYNTVNPSPKAGYEGTFTWKFATKGASSNPSSLGTWSSYLPKNAGTYWIRVELSDGNKNFTTKIYYAVLTINKKELTLTPSGTMTYGNEFKQSDCTFVLSGYVNGDTSVNTVGTVTYALKDASASLVVNGDTGYALVATSTLVTDNYEIVAVEGKLIVNKRPVTVTIDDATSQYKLPLATLSIKTISDSYAENDSKFASNITLTTTATVTSGVNAYVIKGVIDNDNYDVKFVDGTYTITQREVTVTLTNGGGSYKGTITPVAVTLTVVDEQGNVVTLDASESVVVDVMYNGSTTVPSNAGSYGVTIGANASSNANYALANSPTLTFVIDKFVVYVSYISAQTEMFCNKAIEPTIIDKEYDGIESGLYEVVSHEDFINATDYEVQLRLIDFDNYKWDDSANEYTKINFTIAKAGIYAIPSGYVVYGNGQAQFVLSYKVVYADNIESDAIADVKVIGDGVKYVFVDKDALTLNLDKLAAGDYRLTLEVNNGFVVGLESTNDNYSNIALQRDSDGNIVYGKFTVKQREITIKPVDTTSIYSQAIPAATEFELLDDTTLAPFDTHDKIDYSANVNANSNSNQGKYDIVIASAINANYNITIKKGTHTISPIIVDVTLGKKDGIYNDTDAVVTVATLTYSLSGYTYAGDFTSKLVYSFTGTANNGLPYLNSVIPTNAGSYEAIVASISDKDGNFVLGKSLPVSFTIAKKTIDESLITIASKQYNGMEQSHGLANGEGYTVSNGTFKNVDNHTVALTLTDAANYQWSEHKQDATINRTFAITAAPLTLKPYGTITYGAVFDANNADGSYGFELIGLLGDDVGKQNKEIVTGNVIYVLVNGVDGSRLAVKNGGYAMTADVNGLICNNYTITAANGVLNVNKREIIIKPNASASVYGEKVVLSDGFTLVDGTALADWDNEASLNYKVTSSAQSTSNVGAYDVIPTIDNNNYEMKYVVGAHTITKAKVGVSIRAINGTYGDKDNLGRIEFMSVEVLHSDGTTEKIETLKFVIRYVGTAHDLSSYDEHEIPTKAGVYSATVIDVLDDNYEIDATYGDRNTYIEIFKRKIDADKIKAASAEYTGKAIIPTIEDKLYNVDGQKIYRTIFEGELIRVGTYGITLSLIDIYNYEWVDNLNRTTTIEFKIIKANNRLVDVNNPNAQNVKVVISDWTFDGDASKPQATVASGEQNVVFEYAKSENGEYTTEVPKNAGEYWVRATVAASDNYNAYVSAATKFVINKKVIGLPVVNNLNENNVYTGSMLSLQVEGFDDQIMSLTLDKDMYRADQDGKLNLLALNANTYKAVFKLRDAANYEWANNSQTVDGGVVVNWTIERQVVKRLPDASSKIVVNGEDIVFIPDGFNSGIMTIDGNVRAHEGNYSAVVTLKDTKNYVWEGTESASITVVFELTGTNVAFVAAICVVAGLCVGLAVMALILTLVNRRKKRKQEEEIDKRSRADGWEGE